MSNYKFSLPYPPSVNQIWRRGNGRTYLNKRASDYRKKVADALLIEGLVNEGVERAVRVLVKVQAPDKRVRDLDNLPKVIFDSLTACKFWNDDSQVVDMRVCWADVVDCDLDRRTKKGRVHIEVVVL